MNKIITFTVVVLLFTQSAFGQDFNNVKYLKNYDGDTITFDLGSNLPEIFRFMPLRLYGIDSPEIKTKNEVEYEKAIKAKLFVHYELTHAKNINLVNCSKDKYFRILCKVNYDGKDLTEVLLKKDYGYPYYGGKKQKFN